MSEKFSLKWNDYLVNVSRKFSLLRNEEDFSDVTLVTSDKRQVSAHKVVLSSSSDYFKTILQNNNKSHYTILCLENISHEELNFMLDYVYNGEVNIEQDQLDRFLTIAKRFQLEGLISDGSGELEVEDSHYINLKNSNKIQPDTEKVDNFKKISLIGSREHIKISSEEFQTVEELDEKIIENLSRVDGTKKWQCLLCNQVSRFLSHAKEHVEVHFGGLSFPCQNCDKIFRSRSALRNHRTKSCNGKIISGQESY